MMIQRMDHVGAVVDMFAACAPTAPNSSARSRGYEDMYRLCYVRVPEGIIVVLEEQLRQQPPSCGLPGSARVLTIKINDYTRRWSAAPSAKLVPRQR